MRSESSFDLELSNSPSFHILLLTTCLTSRDALVSIFFCTPLGCCNIPDALIFVAVITMNIITLHSLSAIMVVHRLGGVCIALHDFITQSAPWQGLRKKIATYYNISFSQKYFVV